MGLQNKEEVGFLQPKERKIRMMVQSPEVYIIKTDGTSENNTAIVLHLDDCLATILQLADEEKYDFKLFDLYSYKCVLNTKVWITMTK